MLINERIFEYIQQHGQASPKELMNALGVSESAILKGLASLAASEKLVKTSQGRNTFYKLPAESPPVAVPSSAPIFNVRWFLIAFLAVAMVGFTIYLIRIPKRLVQVKQLDLPLVQQSQTPQKEDLRQQLQKIKELEQANQLLLAQIEALSEENKWLKQRYQNIEGLNMDLMNKLKAALVQNKGTTEKDFSVVFDENGDRVK